jgi:hypothetical protein
MISKKDISSARRDLGSGVSYYVNHKMGEIVPCNRVAELITHLESR